MFQVRRRFLKALVASPLVPSLFTSLLGAEQSVPVPEPEDTKHPVVSFCHYDPVEPVLDDEWLERQFNPPLQKEGRLLNGQSRKIVWLRKSQECVFKNNDENMQYGEMILIRSVLDGKVFYDLCASSRECSPTIGSKITAQNTTRWYIIRSATEKTLMFKVQGIVHVDRSFEVVDNRGIMNFEFSGPKITTSRLQWWGDENLITQFQFQFQHNDAVLLSDPRPTTKDYSWAAYDAAKQMIGGMRCVIYPYSFSQFKDMKPIGATFDEVFEKLEKEEGPFRSVHTPDFATRRVYL